MGGSNLLAIASSILVLVILCAGVTAKTDCNKVESKLPMLRLKRHLFCEYDPEVRPVANNDNVTLVKFAINPHSIEYVHDTSIFELHTWVSMMWQDSHLTWDSTQFDDIKLLVVPSYKIWQPDITLHNGKLGENSQYVETKCWILENGWIQWLIPAKFSVYCITDNTWWPYNTLNCTLQIGSWSHSDDEINFMSYQNASLNEIKSSIKSKDVEWDLLKIERTERKVRYKYNSGTTTKLLSYHFILKRHWGIVLIAYVLPSIALMALSLTTLWLEPKSLDRMTIANVNLIGHFLVLQSVHWEVPKGAVNTPLLLSFYEKSLAIALFTIIFTGLLRHLQKLNSDPPVWISNGTTFILRSKVGQILLVNILNPAATAKIEVDADDNTDLMPSNGKKMPWLYVTMLLGRLAFLSILLTYIVLLSMYFPTHHRMN